MSAEGEKRAGHGAAGMVQLRQLLSFRNYRAFILGDVVSLTGNWIQRVAVGWLTWELTHSTTWLGIIAFADLFPAVLAAPIGGVIADRGEPRAISFNTQSLQMLQAVALLGLYVSGFLTIWLLLILTILRGGLAAINQPARMSLVPSLMPREHLSSGLALNSLAFNLSRFIGPVIAGFAIAGGGVGLAVLLNALSYIPMLYALWIINVPAPHRIASPRSVQDTLDQIVAGFVYVKERREIALIMIMLALVALLARPISELLPGFTAQVFNRDATGLAYMTSAMGLGAILGGYSLIGGRIWPSLVHALFSNILVMSFAVVIFALTTNFLLGLLMLAAIGFALAVNGVCTQSLLQASIDDSYRGRVMSLYGVIFRGVPAVGAVAIGVASDGFGLAMPTVLAGLLIGLVWLIMMRYRPGLSKFFGQSRRRD